MFDVKHAEAPGLEGLAIVAGRDCAFLAIRLSTPDWLLIFTLPTLNSGQKPARHPLPIVGRILSGQRNLGVNKSCAG
jgi:hypothetical protein